MAGLAFSHGVIATSRKKMPQQTARLESVKVLKSVKNSIQSPKEVSGLLVGFPETPEMG